MTEGRYHQVKRMVAGLATVSKVCRVAVGGLQLPADLAPGAWRWLDDGDLARLHGIEAVPD